MLRTEDPSVQEAFDKLSVACKRRMQELLAPLEKEFDRSVLADGAIEMTIAFLREGYKLQQFNRQIVMEVLLRMQFKIFPVSTHIVWEPIDDANATAIQRRFNSEVADCTDKLAAITGPVLRQSLAPIAINALFVLMKSHMVAALENGFITSQMAREYCQQLRGDLLPAETAQSLN